jgi:hypothetical protein
VVWFGLVWFAGRWTDKEVSRLIFSEGKKNAVALGVVICSFPRKSMSRSKGSDELFWKLKSWVHSTFAERVSKLNDWKPEGRIRYNVVTLSFNYYLCKTI